MHAQLRPAGHKAEPVKKTKVGTETPRPRTWLPVVPGRNVSEYVGSRGGSFQKKFWGWRNVTDMYIRLKL